MSDSIQHTTDPDEEQLSDETLESVAGGTGAALGSADIGSPILKYPGGDDGCYPLPVAPELSV